MASPYRTVSGFAGKTTRPDLRFAVVLAALLCITSIFSGNGNDTAHADVDATTKFMPTAMTRLEVFALDAGVSKTVQVAGNAGVPATEARAVLLNVSVTNASANSYVTAWPEGIRPDTSSLHVVANESVSNSMVVPLAADGSIQVYNQSGSATITTSVEGYFVDDTTGSGGFVPVAASRIINTAGSTPIPANGSLDVKITDVAGVAAGARSVFVNLTASTPSAEGYLAVTAKGSTETPRASVMFSPGTSVANSVTMVPDASGYVTVHNKSAAPVNMVMDAQGYFNADSTAGEVFLPVSIRAYDSRALGTQIAADQTLDIDLGEIDGLPGDGGMTAVFANVMALDPATTGYMRVWSGNQTEPGLNNTIFAQGESRASLTSTKVSPDGIIKVRNVSAGTLHLVVDIQGFFAPAVLDDGADINGEGTGTDPTAEETEQDTAKMDVANKLYAATFEGGSSADFESVSQAYVNKYGIAVGNDSASCIGFDPCRPPTSYTTSLSQVGQQKSWWCGPATAYEIVRQLYTNGKISTTKSKRDGKSLSQANLAGTTYLKAVSEGTYRTDMKNGLNLWTRNSTSGMFSVNSTPTASEFRSALVNNIYQRISIATSAYERAGAAHYNGHPSTRTIDHWIAAYGYSSAGGTVQFADSSTTLWRSVKPKFSASTTSFVNNYVSSKAIVW